MAGNLKARLFCTLFASTFGAAICSTTLPAHAQQAAVPTDFTAVVKQKAPAVVAILTKQMIEDEARQAPDDLPLGELFRRRFGEPRARERTALGSGFIVSPEGHIVTNNHVVDNASEIHVASRTKPTWRRSWSVVIHRRISRCSRSSRGPTWL